LISIYASIKVILSDYCSKTTVQSLQAGLLTSGRERQNSWKYRPAALCLGLDS